MPVNLSSLFSAVNEVSPVNNKEAQSAENAGNTSGAQNISGTIQKTADEAGIAMLKNMLKGDTFSGQIINVSDGNALFTGETSFTAENNEERLTGISAPDYFYYGTNFVINVLL